VTGYLPPGHLPLVGVTVRLGQVRYKEKQTFGRRHISYILFIMPAAKVRVSKAGVLSEDPKDRIRLSVYLSFAPSSKTVHFTSVVAISH